jgi:hypothetical protein
VKKFLFKISIIWLISSSWIYAQSPTLSLSDTLKSDRKVFTTTVYRNSGELSNQRLALLLQPSRVWSKKFKISRVLLPAGPVVAAGGIYLAYDAIKGIPMVAEIDGQLYPYTVRSLPKLLGGIAFFVIGMSMVESANETKANAVKWYNGYLIKEIEANSKSSSVNFRMGLQENGRLGMVLKF